MDLENIIAVSSMGGLFFMVANRTNGLIVEPLGGGKRKFISIRKYSFTPLQTVAIFTKTDSEELSTVFSTMLEKEKELALPSAKDSSDKLTTYFQQIVPDFDPEKVMVSDIRRVIKWFEELKAHGKFEDTGAGPDEEE
jgi:hypothetical protein